MFLTQGYILTSLNGISLVMPLNSTGIEYKQYISKHIS